VNLLYTLSHTYFDNDFGTNKRAWIPSVMAVKAVETLNANIVMPYLVNTDFKNEVKSKGNLVETRKVGKFTAQTKGTTDDVVIQDATAEYITVPLDQYIYTSFIIADADMSMSAFDLLANYITPAVKSLAERIDKMLLNQLWQFRASQVGKVGGPTGTDDTRTDITETGKVLSDNLVPEGGRNLVVTNEVFMRMQRIDLYVSAERVDDGGSAIIDAKVARRDGFDIYKSIHAPHPNLQAGTLITTGAAGSIDGAHVIGATAITVTTDATGVYNVGQYLTFEDDVAIYRITAVAATEISIDQGLRVALADDDLPTYYTEGTVDLAGHTGTTSYPIGYVEQIRVDGTQAPEVGKLTSFTTSGGVARTGEYGIVDVEVVTAGTTWYIRLDRPLVEACENNDIVNYGPAGEFCFAFDQGAVTLVSRPLQVVQGGLAQSFTAVVDNLALRVTITYEGRSTGYLCTVDMLAGVKVLDEDRGAIMLG
jgi:hypothetical protein